MSRSLAAIDPWLSLGYSAAALANYLSRADLSLHRYAVFKGGTAIGALCVRYPWLRGPYIELLGLDENHQGQGIGSELLAWIEQETKPHANNIWVATSTFNTRAITIYERFGFTQVGLLDGLVMDGKSEVLMRKRLPRE